MRIAIIGCLAISSIAMCPAAQARRSSTAQELDRVKDFRLARDLAARGSAGVAQAITKADHPFPKEKLGPSWSYRPIEKGPQVEIGALGAGEIDAPGLMHVGMNWHF